ncbi:MAG: hypothetical protein V4717_08750 [Bacteroidota bacterium]
MEILVFKTDIANAWHKNMAQKLLSNLNGILKSTVDMEDIDHVLRVEANNLPPKHVELVLMMAGYYCEEMKD